MTAERHAAAVAAGERILLIVTAARAASPGDEYLSALPAIAEVLVEGVATVDTTRSSAVYWVCPPSPA